jgi:hypothetical protein
MRVVNERNSIEEPSPGAPSSRRRHGHTTAVARRGVHPRRTVTVRRDDDAVGVVGLDRELDGGVLLHYGERVPGGRTGPVAAEVDQGAARQRRDRQKEYDERTKAAVQVRPSGRAP